MRKSLFGSFLPVAVIIMSSLSTCCLSAQAVNSPVPTELSSARTLFIANLGEDEFPYPGDAAGVPQGVYQRVYTAVSGWGRYHLTSSPAEADLILEIRSYFVGTEHTSLPFAARRLDYAIVDRTTHVTLWAGTIHVERAARQRTLETNLDKAISYFVENFKTLVDRSGTKP